MQGTRKNRFGKLLTRLSCFSPQFLTLGPDPVVVHKRVFLGAAVAVAVLIVGSITVPAIGAATRSHAARRRASASSATAASTQAAEADESRTDTQAEIALDGLAADPDADNPDVERVSDTLNEVDATFVDASRGRTIPVTVYYPAEAGAYPLVVFAPGYAVSAATYATLEQEVAGAGFVLVAPDFPLSSTAVTSDPIRDPVAQATDVSFVINSLLDPATRPSALADRIALTRVGVIGHSDGGITAAGVAYNSEYADSRIGAAVVLSGAEAFFPGDWFTTASPPLLAVHGDSDEVNPFGASQTIFDGATGPKWLVKVVGGSHLGPFTTDSSVDSVSVLVADFLRAELQGDPAAAPRVDSDANTGSLALVAQG